MSSLSLKQLSKLVLTFSVESRCGGLALYDRLSSPKLRKTNPSCEIVQRILPPGGTAAASLELKYADEATETLDITAMHGEEVFEAISRRVEERNTQELLAKNKFVGSKLESSWGL